MTSAADWEIRPDETHRQYAAFRVYLEMGPKDRQIKAAGATFFGQDPLKASQSDWIYTQSRTHDWQARARAYDMWVLREADRALIWEVREARERHARIARAALSKLTARLAALDPNEIGVPQLFTGIEKLVKLELLSLGEPTEVLSAQDGLTEEERRKRVMEDLDRMLDVIDVAGDPRPKLTALPSPDGDDGQDGEVA